MNYRDLSEFVTSLKWKQKEVFPHRRRRAMSSVEILSKTEAKQHSTWLKRNDKKRQMNIFFLNNSHISRLIVWLSPSLMLLVGVTSIIYLPLRSQPACLGAGIKRRQDPMTVHQKTVTTSKGGVKVVRQQLQPDETVGLRSENNTQICNCLQKQFFPSSHCPNG